MTEELLQAANENEIESWRYFFNVPIQISVELGRTRMTARTILELEKSSIIQLPHSTGDGVDLLAGDQSIGRGEIVMIEDHTGVRVSEISSEDHR